MEICERVLDADATERGTDEGKYETMITSRYSGKNVRRVLVHVSSPHKSSSAVYFSFTICEHVRWQMTQENFNIFTSKTHSMGFFLVGSGLIDSLS